MSTFGYKEFAINMAEQAKALAPNDLDKNAKSYLVMTVKNFTYLAGEAISNDETLNFDEDKCVFLSQIIAEWTFHKCVDLARSSVPQEYWDAILQKIAYAIYSVVTEGIKKKIEEAVLLEAVEQQVIKAYNVSLEELTKKDVISEDVKNSSLSLSNIDLMAKEIANGMSIMYEPLDEEKKTKVRFDSVKNTLISLVENIFCGIKSSFEFLVGLVGIFLGSKKNALISLTIILALFAYNKYLTPITEYLIKFDISSTTASAVIYTFSFFIVAKIFISEFHKLVEKDIKEQLEQLEEVKQNMKDLVDPDKQFERLGVDILCLQVGAGLVPIADPDQENQICPQLAALRQKLTDELGYIIPKVRILDNNKLEDNEYVISVRNKEIARGVVFPDKIMVYPNYLEKNHNQSLKEISEINFDYNNSVVYWINADIAESSGIEGIDATTFILNHLEDILISYVDKILTMTTTYKYITLCRSQDYMEDVLNDLMIRLDVADIRKVLVNLIKQRVSIKDIIFIFEKLNDYSREEKNPEKLAELLKKDLV